MDKDLPIVSRKPIKWTPDFQATRKPRLRGWIHLVTTPLAVIATTILIILAPTTQTKVAASVYLAVSLILFGMSALYHVPYWKPSIELLLKRFDHSNIFLLIAGTYTAVSFALNDPGQRRILLIIVWTGAIAGIIINLAWPTAPRWLQTLIYIALGWSAIWYIPAMWHDAGPAVVWLVFAGGILYTVGAVAYATKRPNPIPGWFGFHEVFHAHTAMAWACHCTAAYLAILR